jgi:hypothetical protein
VTGDATLTSSVGVKLGSGFTSSGLLTSEAGVKRAGTGRVGSRPAGYERGSARLILEREEFEDAILLPPEELENVEAIESRERHDDPEDEDEFVLVVAVDMKEDAMELRPVQRKRQHSHATTDLNIRDCSVCENIC